MRRLLAASLLAMVGCRADPAPPTAAVVDAAAPDASTAEIRDLGAQVRRAARPIQQIESNGSSMLCVVDAEGAVGCHGYLNVAGRHDWPTFSFGPVAEISVVDSTVCARSREGGKGECVWLELGKVTHRWKVPVNGVRQLTAGWAFCALLEDETVRCWPRRGGQAKIGSEPPSSPGEQSYPAQGFQHPVRLTSAPCALEADGHIACATLKLMPGSSPTPAFESFDARRVDDLDDAVEVAENAGVGCARRKDGTVWCWGDNRFFRLAHERPGDFPHPRKIPGVADAVQVQISRSHVCALVKDGSVLCWGHGASGEMQRQGKCKFLEAPGKDEYRSCAVSTVERMPDYPAARQIAVGSAHTCSLSLGDEIACWGGRSARDLGGSFPADSASGAMEW